MHSDKDQEIADLRTEIGRLNKILNTPLYDDFIEAVRAEASHQRWRWGKPHDDAKTPEDWLGLIHYLAGKAKDAHERGDRRRALHHTISSAAALMHWHDPILEQLPARDRTNPDSPHTANL